MGKRSKRSQRQRNKDHAGCMWGLISMFDFRHGQTTRRLLSDKRIVTKDIEGKHLVWFRNKDTIAFCKVLNSFMCYDLHSEISGSF